MKKIFSTTAIKEKHYKAEEVIVWCFDFRFFKALKKIIGNKKVDIISVAGGAKHLASPLHPLGAEFILNQIKTSIKLHLPKKIIIMCHDNCGAYNGIEGIEFYKKELLKAERFLKKHLRGIAITKVFVDLKGNIWKV